MIKLTSSVTVPVRRFVVIIVLAVLILALAAPTFAAAGEDPLDELRAAWDHAARAGAYHFSVELHQANAPAQSVANIGQQAHTEQYHIEGARMTGEADLEMTMWSNGGTALDFSDGVSVRVQGDKAYARYGESAWEEINNFTGLFAPNNDPLAYLSAASQVEWVGEEQALGETYNHYRYTIDSALFGLHERAA